MLGRFELSAQCFLKSGDVREALRNQAYQKIFVDLKEAKQPAEQREIQVQASCLFLRSAVGTVNSGRDLNALELRETAVNAAVCLRRSNEPAMAAVVFSNLATAAAMSEHNDSRDLFVKAGKYFSEANQPAKAAKAFQQAHKPRRALQVPFLICFSYIEHM